ncbi:hypothetical protein WUBG_06650 [Wuchereria bancrofti]|uniref:Activin types I and II receptor domain-containing protein n=1 Tax=Wuchereria bancrofti TaxID=6293 RepID=J9B5X6_WUCBA|nr:hypothetical protein WUBG_06650 [Wuchereria bancrofti]VDM10492.1 unnamed protein product [Wuchereria bancrofti]
MWHYSLSTTIYSILIIIIIIILHFQTIHSLRCKCNANRGPSPCVGDFCDIHNRDGKRAACGALRRSRQTIFACVLIRQSSNDTYCHVIGSTTACWCRQMDFCNVDLEAELFDVDESMDDNSKDNSNEILSTNFIADNSRHKQQLESMKSQSYHRTRIPIQSFNITTITMKTITTTTSTTTAKTLLDKKQSMKMKINSAIQIDVIEKIKLTPERENPPTVVTEIISDSYEYTLDEE